MTDKELMKHCKEKNALSYNDIKNMSQEELGNLISVCWHDSQYNGGCNKKSLRCWDRGIIDLGLVTLNSRGNTAYVISWSDFSGGPTNSYFAGVIGGAAIGLALSGALLRLYSASNS
jgi:hypothetical protein